MNALEKARIEEDAGHSGAPADGRTPTGPLPRAVRGGRACCYPRQECAELTLMLCAERGDGNDLRGFCIIRLPCDVDVSAECCGTHFIDRAYVGNRTRT